MAGPGDKIKEAEGSLCGEWGQECSSQAIGIACWNYAERPCQGPPKPEMAAGPGEQENALASLAGAHRELTRDGHRQGGRIM